MISLCLLLFSTPIPSNPGINTAINIDDNDSKKVSEQVPFKWKALFYVITIVVLTALLVKLPLYLARQVVPHSTLHLLCPEKNASQLQAGHEYIFTTVVYSGLFIGRCIECLILQIHVYKFFFKHYTASQVNELKELCVRRLKTNKKVVAIVVGSSIYMFVHSFAVPALGIALEVKSGRETHCEPYVYEYHTMYWILDIIRYSYDTAVRLLMMLATVAVGIIWSDEYKNSALTEPDACARSESIKEPTNYTEYLKDRETVSIDHCKRWQEYVIRGERVECILEIFQTWFVIPWILYFVGSSLNTDHILRAWKDGPGGDGEYDFSEVAYLVFNFNQLSLLTLPYLCSKKMNADHYEYVSRSRKQQLDVGSASRMAFAHMNRIEEEDHFNFVPRIWGSSIKIQVENPLYIMLLLVGIFFTVVEALI